MDFNFIILIELLGTLSFSISGIRLASRKQIDWFGAYIIGLVTAIGGGTLRDLLLDLPAFWMEDPKYFIVTGVALLATLIFKDNLIKWTNTLFLFDAIGLGLFTVAGISKSFEAGFPVWICVVMGTITGSVGGVIRDVLLNEVPLLFRKDVYALACVAGGVVYFVCYYLHVQHSITAVAAAATVIVIRVLAVRFHWHLPTLKPAKAAGKV